MANSLFITATESRAGKTLVSLGVMDMLLRSMGKVAFFRPIVHRNPVDGGVVSNLELITSVFQLGIPMKSMYAFTSYEVDALLSQGREDELYERIYNKYQALAREYDFVLCEGTDFASSTASFEFDINAEISRNLNAPVLLVSNAANQTKEEILRGLELAIGSLDHKGCQLLGTVINRVESEEQKAELLASLQQRCLAEGQVLICIPQVEMLTKPTVDEIATALNAEVLYGHDQLHRHVYSQAIGAMHVQEMLPRIERGSLMITPGDRADVIITCLAAVSSHTMERISGILLTGGFRPSGMVSKLIEGMPVKVPILLVADNTYPAATTVDNVKATFFAHDEKKIALALSVFEEHGDFEQLREKIIKVRAPIITPRKFQYFLAHKAKEYKQHIVLPEGEERRILQAADVLAEKQLVELTLLGRADKIGERANELNLALKNVNIVEPGESPLRDSYMEKYYELRKHKGITLDNAGDAMLDVNYFGTMMVYMGDADGMVSGAAHTTAATIRPAFEFVKARPGADLVSSVFFICLKDRVLVYGDCAVNPDPNATQLASIALSSAQTASTFGIEPVVAMLSYSTGTSGRGADVEKVREATELANKLAKERGLKLMIDGPIQYDAASDPEVALTKMPDSKVAGRATVYIFPDLNTGNNTYKAVQRTTGALAIGPVLQGLNRPVNDLSRGCTVKDIINTVAITAIQAQEDKSNS
jgi:phosphate acetyltransferase